jgi:hypothetical protein
MRFVRGQTGKRGRRPGQCGTQFEGEKGHAFAWSQLGDKKHKGDRAEGLGSVWGGERAHAFAWSQLGDKKQNGGRAEGLGSVWEEKGHMRLCGLSWETRNKMGAGGKAWAVCGRRKGTCVCVVSVGRQETKWGQGGRPGREAPNVRVQRRPAATGQRTSPQLTNIKKTNENGQKGWEERQSKRGSGRSRRGPERRTPEGSGGIARRVSVGGPATHQGLAIYC